MQFNMSTRCLRTVNVCFTMTFIQLDQMGHQTMETVRSGAIIMTTVRDSLPIMAHVTLKSYECGNDIHNGRAVLYTKRGK